MSRRRKAKPISQDVVDMIELRLRVAGEELREDFKFIQAKKVNFNLFKSKRKDTKQ